MTRKTSNASSRLARDRSTLLAPSWCQQQHRPESIYAHCALTALTKDRAAFPFLFPSECTLSSQSPPPLFSRRPPRALMTRQHCSVSALRGTISPFLCHGCSSSFRPCTRPKMHPDCPTVSPYRTPSKLQLRTLQARLALLSRFRRYTRASRKLLFHLTRAGVAASDAHEGGSVALTQHLRTLADDSRA